MCLHVPAVRVVAARQGENPPKALALRDPRE
jgi:hypothetical protein